MSQLALVSESIGDGTIDLSRLGLALIRLGHALDVQTQLGRLPRMA